jgi:Icc-related predicted phosphoesterase
VIIDCIGCLHGAQPELNGGDLLIITGDITARDTEYEYVDKFLPWLIDLHMTKYEKVVWIGGNHDNWVQENISQDKQLSGGEYLCDSGTEFEGLKIWGSPWSIKFPGINPNCCAFTVENEEQLKEKWQLIPDDTDILITHSPPFGICDKISNGKRAGSVSLRDKSYNSNAQLHVFSHIHEGYGVVTAHIRLSPKKRIRKCLYVNCSIMDKKYQPVHAPIRIELSDEDFPKGS